MVEPPVVAFVLFFSFPGRLDVGGRRNDYALTDAFVVGPTGRFLGHHGQRRGRLPDRKIYDASVVNLVRENFAEKVIPTAKFSPPEVDEFELAGLTEKPSEKIAAPGIAGSYAWMECELFKLYEEPQYILIMGKVVRLEVADDALTDGGELDVAKVRPLMMTGTRKGMNFCTVTDSDRFEPFSAMFPDGRDPLGKKYQKT